VPLPRFLCEQLAAYLAERPHGPEDLVFTAPQGGPLREQKFVAGIFKPAAVQAGLPHRLRFHDLRHTCASLLIAQGASVKAVQAQLGHASATVTLDRYGHLFPDELQQLADRLQAAYADAITDPARTEAAERCFEKAKEQVSDLLLVVEVGRLELPGLGIRVRPPSPALMVESGC
jgi:Phage integrase family